jgi:hypothetical protein
MIPVSERETNESRLGAMSDEELKEEALRQMRRAEKWVEWQQKEAEWREEQERLERGDPGNQSLGQVAKIKAITRIHERGLARTTVQARAAAHLTQSYQQARAREISATQIYAARRRR